jgi:hypothetical protein
MPKRRAFIILFAEGERPVDIDAERPPSFSGPAIEHAAGKIVDVGVAAQVEERRFSPALGGELMKAALAAVRSRPPSMSRRCSPRDAGVEAGRHDIDQAVVGDEISSRI